MSEAKLDITGSTAVAQREVDKLTKGLAAAREQIRQLNQSTKESTGATNSWAAGMERLKTQNDRWAQGMKRLQDQQPKRVVAGMSLDGLHEATMSLGSMASGLVGIGTAVSLVSRGYSAWEQKVDSIIHSHDELALTITKTLAEAGKLQLGPQIEEWAKSQKGATPQQAMAAIGGVMQSGETLSSERTMQVATEIAKLAPTGIDLTRTGTLAADVADIAGEGVSASDVADLTVGIKQQLREKTEEFQGRKFQKQIEHLKRGGMSGEDALAHAVAALQSEQGSEALKVLATKGGERTADQRRMLKDVFAPDKIAAVKKQMLEFKAKDLAAGELTALQQFQSGREVSQEQVVAEEEARTAEQYPEYSALKRARRKISARAYQRGGMMFGASTDVMHSMDWAAVAVAGPGAIGGAEIKQAQNQGLLSKAEADELIAALKDNTKATVQNTPRTKNVDAHTE